MLGTHGAPPPTTPPLSGPDPLAWIQRPAILVYAVGFSVRPIDARDFGHYAMGDRAGIGRAHRRAREGSGRNPRNGERPESACLGGDETLLLGGGKWPPRSRVSVSASEAISSRRLRTACPGSMSTQLVVAERCSCTG